MPRDRERLQYLGGQALGFEGQVWGLLDRLGFGPWGFGIRAWGSGLRVWGSGFGVGGLRFAV